MATGLNVWDVIDVKIVKGVVDFGRVDKESASIVRLKRRGTVIPTSFEVSMKNMARISLVRMKGSDFENSLSRVSRRRKVVAAREGGRWRVLGGWRRAWGVIEGVLGVGGCWMVGGSWAGLMGLVAAAED